MKETILDDIARFALSERLSEKCELKHLESIEGVRYITQGIGSAIAGFRPVTSP